MLNRKLIRIQIIIVSLFVINIHSQNLILSDFNNKLNPKGIDLKFNYTGEVFSNLSGGLERKTVYLDNIDIVLNLDLNKMVGWKGATINTYFLGNHGSVPSEYSVTIQGTSNIAAHETWKLYEFWIQQNFLDDNLSLLVGLFDLNSEFDTRETSLIFINPSHGIGAEYSLTGKNGPSIFPTTSLAFRASYKLSNSFNIRAAVFDGVPGDLNNPNGTSVALNKNDGVLIASEINYVSESGEFDNRYFKFAVGGWYYTDEFEKLGKSNNEGNSLTQQGNSGIYAFAEKFLYEEHGFMNQGLTGFLRVGIADQNVNQVDGYFGTGINYIGLIPGRDEDIFGFAIAASHYSTAYKSLKKLENHASKTKDFEYIFELTYSFTPMEFLQIQPDIQYVVNPGNSYNNENAFVFGTRFQLAL